MIDASSEFIQAVGDEFQVDLIASELVCGGTTENEDELLCTMKDQGFDVLGIRENNKVKGFYTYDGITGKIAMNLLTNDDVISANTPIYKLYNLLSCREFFFLLDQDRISKIVTIADLNKPPSRVYLFSIVSALEMHLKAKIRECFGDNQFEELLNILNDHRVEEMKKIYKSRKANNVEIDHVDCIQIADIKEIFRNNNDLTKYIGFKGKKEVHLFFDNLQLTRDTVVHSKSFIDASMLLKVSLIHDKAYNLLCQNY